MIRLLLSLAGLLASYGLAWADTPAAEDIGAVEASAGNEAAPVSIATVQQYLDGIGSLQARFEQLSFDAEDNVTQTSTGSFRLLRPGKFRWDYREPYEQTIVADGERLWIYDADLEQVTVRRMDESMATTPATLLSGVGKLADSYEVQDQFSAWLLDWIELRTKEGDTDFGVVRLGFSGGKRELLVMDLVDSLGQTTRISFFDIDRSSTLLPSVFTFVPPPGADVIGEGEL